MLDETLSYCQFNDDLRVKGECMVFYFYKHDTINEMHYYFHQYLSCVENCINEQNPQKMNPVQLQDYKENIKKDPLLHNGNSFLKIDCDPQQRKKAVIELGHTGSGVYNYMIKSRCDYLTFQKELNSDYDDYDFLWGKYNSSINFGKRKENQVINLIQGFGKHLGNKDGCLQTLIDYENNTKQIYNMSYKDFHFKTYQFDFKQKEFSQQEQEFMDQQDGLWITKQPNGSVGLGITVHKNVKDLQQQIKKMKKNYKDYENIERIQQYNYIQQYLSNPLLVNKKKNDIRVYALIVSVEPLILLFQPGFVRFCIEDYDNNNFEGFDLSVALRHLTNRSYQKRHVDYNSKSYSLLKTLYDYEILLKEEYHLTDEYIQKELYQRMKEIIAYIVIAGRSKLYNYKNAFQFIGIDFIIDSNFKTHFIEMNQTSGFYNELKQHKLVIPQLIQSSLDLLLDQLGQNKDLNQIWKNPEKLDLGRWDIIINEATGYNILDKYLIQ